MWFGDGVWGKTGQLKVPDNLDLIPVAPSFALKSDYVGAARALRSPKAGESFSEPGGVGAPSTDSRRLAHII